MEPADSQQALNLIVEEVFEEAQIDRTLMLPEELEYIRRHALRKPLRVIHIWGLGVGSVIAGMFFGWNYGLPIAGPIGMLIASLIVCGLYLTWVLGLSELSVAMPFAGGPMTYGRRAFGRSVGFFMGWSMLLECLFGGIGTALAAGGYVAFLLNPEHPSALATTGSAAICAVLFLVVQYIGVKEQARITLWLTWAAIAALVCFWVAAAPAVSMTRIVTAPLLTHGWSGVLTAIPYALWWLVVIESVALASEEAHQPHITIPRGMVFAQITLVVMVLLTWFFTTAAAPYAATGAVAYPLPLVLKQVWGAGLLFKVFSILSLAGLVVSYNGMLYATSRQLFSLGRAGYLPKFLGSVHHLRRTPQAALLVATIITLCFIVAGFFYSDATSVAILISTFAAVVWYVLAMMCLLVLRRKQPGMHRPYAAPGFPWLAIFVGVVAAFAGYLYAWVNVQVLLPGLLLYAGAALWYGLRGRKTVLKIAPEEISVRIAERLVERHDSAPFTGTAVITRQPARTSPRPYLTATILCAGLLSLVWMVARATDSITGPVTKTEISTVSAIWAVLFLLISWVGYQSTQSPAE